MKQLFKTIINKLFLNEIKKLHVEQELNQKLRQLQIFQPSNSVSLKKTEIKNVLMINTNVGKGGAEKIVEAVGVNLPKYQISAYFLVKCGENNNLTLNYLANDTTTLKKTADQLGYIDLFHWSSDLLPTNSFYEQADVLHLHNLHGDYFNLFALPLLTQNKPTVWTLHDEQSLTGHCAFSMGCER